MNIEICGASTLASFTRAIEAGFRSALASRDSSNFALIQIHGAPAAREEDEKLIERARQLKTPHAFLIHRPDELLLNPRLRTHFDEHPEARLIFLGDLTFRDDFWNSRKAQSLVTTHPQLDLSLPPETLRPIVGTFTAWGEMRKPEHFFALVENLRNANRFDFRIGGTGLTDLEIPKGIEIATEPFLPHFNVQLYHLNGKKRYCESSGSLHRGVSIPVIFEANGAERLEGLHAVKVEASDDLELMEFEKAADEITRMTLEILKTRLADNREAAEKNSPTAFAQKILSFISSNSSQNVP